MLKVGEKLGITSVKEWSQMMGGRLLITTNNNSSSTSANTNKNNMTHANSATSNASRVMDKPSAQNQTQGTLRCPRCDSSNTKFCYYNNYSLSQPRHFCKACKRYWTRGGTLRNVPVGGGCRKNKRAKKAAATHMAPTNRPHPCPLLPPDPIHYLSVHKSSSSHLDTAAFYTLQTRSPSSDMSLTLPNIANNIQIPSCTTAFDLQAHLGALGLGLPSDPLHDNKYHLGQLHPLPSVSSSLMSPLNDFPLFGSSSQSAPLPLSSIKQPNQVEDYQALLPFDESQDSGRSGSITGMKEVKLEGQTNNMINSNISSFIDWQIPSDNSLDNFGPAAIMYWNAAIGGSASWPDVANFGSSLAPLI